MAKINPFFQRHLATVARREYMRDRLIQQQKQERSAGALISYLKAHEQSQAEVISSWNAFLESAIQAVIDALGCDPNDMELQFGHLREDFSQDIYILVHSEVVLKVSRSNNAIDIGDTGVPVEWEFSSTPCDELPSPEPTV